MIKKLFVGFTILLLITRVSFFVPAVSLAQEVPTDTPTPTEDNAPTATPTPDATVSPTPTDDPSISPTDTPTPDVTVDATNNAAVTNDATSSATSGDNTITTDATDSATPTDDPSDTPTGSPTNSSDTSVTTGNSVATSTTQNSVNTTSVNSQIVYQTINIFLDQNGNIDLSAPIDAAEQVAANTANASTDVLMTGVNNYATVHNVVTANADTGDNTTSTNGQVVVDTGNAYALAQLINTVNVTLSDSTIHIVTINIYGNMNGNIILPQINGQATCTSCEVNLTTQNNAVVNNTADATANSGDNTVTASDAANVQTGNAVAIVNLTNFINSLLENTSFGQLYINTYGTWNGSFLGWDGSSATNEGNTLAVSDVPQTTDVTNNDNQNITDNNNALVSNTVDADANTGKNTTSGNNATVTTGNAYAFVNVINLINSLFVNSNGFFGFINIFGNLNGNIGGQDYFPTPTPQPNAVVADATDTTGTIDPNGQLAVTTTNNAGKYILPGDTITLFATITNPGTGPVYNTVLHVSLIHNGIEQGAQDIAIGTINGGKSVHITTGIVISGGVPPGDFIARMTADAVTADNQSVSNFADSTFTIFGQTIGAATNTQVLPTPPVLHKAVLGLATSPKPAENNTLYFILGSVLLAYIAIRVIRAREQLVLLFTPGANFKARLNTLRLFLL